MFASFNPTVCAEQLYASNFAYEYDWFLIIAVERLTSKVPANIGPN